MAESQSRYSIIEELNNRKINVKESLANIERETDNKVYDTEKKLEQLNQQINQAEKTYERDYLDQKRQTETKLKLLESDFQREKSNFLFVLEDRKNNYTQEFNAWKLNNLNVIKSMSDDLTRYKEVQSRKIEEKKEIITEIERSIGDLKEISKESSKDKN